MKKITTGSGITERTYESLDHANIKADLEYTKAVFDKAIKKGSRYKRIYNKACKILTDAGLPFFSAVAYWRDNPEKWQRAPVVEANHTGKCIWTSYYGGFRRWGTSSTSKDELTFLPDYIINVRGYPEDSPQGYAARLLDGLLDMSLAEQSKDIAGCFASAFDLGMLVKESSMKVRLEPSVMAYQSSKQGGKTGAENAAQSRQQEAELKRQEIEALAKQLLANGKQRHQLAEVISKRKGISARTVRRHLRNSTIL